MARATRPSDVFPPATRAAPSAAAPRANGKPAAGPTPPDRRPAAIVLALILVGLVVAGVVENRGSPVVPAAPPVPVDLVLEDALVGALGLFQTQAEALDQLRVDSVFAAPGPGELALRAAAGATAIDTARRSAVAASAAIGFGREYATDPHHSDLIRRLAQQSDRARSIAGLAAVHDALFTGAGSAAADVAGEQRLASLAAGPDHDPVAAWARALVAQLDGQDAAAAAATARGAVDDQWAVVVSTLTEPGVETLRAYLAGVAPATLTALRGHPVAGPAMQRLALK